MNPNFTSTTWWNSRYPPTSGVSPNMLLDEHHQQRMPPPNTLLFAEATHTNRSTSVSLPLLLSYPPVSDIPADISVDEIFQQTNIVIGRHSRPMVYQEVTNTYHVDDDIDHVSPGSRVNDDHPHNNAYSEYYDSNDYHVDCNIHQNIDEIDEEEAAYRYKANPLHQLEQIESPTYRPDDRFDASGSDDYNNSITEADGVYAEEYAVSPQHLSSNSYYESNDVSNNRYDTRWDDEQHHHYPHSEIVPVALPELDDTSGHSSSHQDDDSNQNNYNDRFYTPSSRNDAPIRSENNTEAANRIPTIEISPGKYLPLRGAKETMYAIECGFCVTIPCTICDQSLICIANCELVLCPTCRIVSPNTATMLKHTTRKKNNTVPTTRGIVNEEQEDDDIVLRLEVKSGVGLGLQVPLNL